MKKLSFLLLLSSISFAGTYCEDVKEKIGINFKNGHKDLYQCELEKGSLPIRAKYYERVRSGKMCVSISNDENTVLAYGEVMIVPKSNTSGTDIGILGHTDFLYKKNLVLNFSLSSSDRRNLSVKEDFENTDYHEVFRNRLAASTGRELNTGWEDILKTWAIFDRSIDLEFESTLFTEGVAHGGFGQSLARHEAEKHTLKVGYCPITVV